MKGEVIQLALFQKIEAPAALQEQHADIIDTGDYDNEER